MRSIAVHLVIDYNYVPVFIFSWLFFLLLSRSFCRLAATCAGVFCFLSSCFLFFSNDAWQRLLPRADAAKLPAKPPANARPGEYGAACGVVAWDRIALAVDE